MAPDARMVQGLSILASVSLVIGKHSYKVCMEAYLGKCIKVEFIIEYPELEGTGKSHWLQLLALHRTIQKSNPMLGLSDPQPGAGVI